MVIENSRYRRRRAVLLWTLLFVASRVYQAEAIGLSRNPLFGGLYNYRRHAPPAATAHSLQQQQHHHQKPFQFPHQTYQPEALSAASQVAQNSAQPASTYNTGVDPYISGSNSIDNTQQEVNEGAAVSSSVSTPAVAEPLLAQTAGNLATAASHTRYNSYASTSGSSGYGGSSGGSAGGYSAGASSGGYGAASGGGASGGYGSASGGGAYGAGSSTGGSYGSGAGANPYAAGGGSGGGGAYGGAGGAGGSSYGSAGGFGGFGGHSSGFGGGGSIGSYGAGPSYTVSYAQQTGPTKADTLNLLSSLAPSLLLSGLLLPLSLALLTNVSGLVTGRKKRDVLNMQDSDEEFDDDTLQFPLDFDDLDARISGKDEQFFPATSAMLEVYSPGDADRLSEFVREKGLLDKKNTCLQKMACMTSLSTKFKKSEKLQNAIKLLDKTNNKEINQRIKEGKTAASLGENECLTKFTCQRLKTA